MRTLSSAVLAGAALIAGAAVAADMPAPYEEVEFGSNWYLRGDVGFKIYATPNVYYNDPVAGVGNFRKEELGMTGVLGGGFGYKFNNWVRADLTVDYEFPSEFKGRARCNGCAGKDYSREWADVSAWTILVNGYVDLGTWNGITPYVGAGVGTSSIEVGNYRYRNPNGVRGTWKDGSDWSFSWAGMAGIAYAISPNASIDLGYRYLAIGDGRTGNIPIGTGRNPVRFDDLAAHEVRVGFRYMID